MPKTEYSIHEAKLQETSGPIEIDNGFNEQSPVNQQPLHGKLRGGVACAVKSRHLGLSSPYRKLPGDDSDL